MRSTPDRLVDEGGQPYGWDVNGNLTAKAVEATYTWDVEDQLESVSLADGTVVLHTYDADGVRVRTETTPPSGPPEVVNYLVDTSGPISHVVAETDGAGNLRAYYVRGDDLLAVIRPVIGARFYHADGLGSIRTLTDETGAVTDRWSFTAFGELLERVGSDDNAYLFAGEPLDPNSGLYYNRARWMDPAVGRFASLDPLPPVLSIPLTGNVYLYAGANGVQNLDPTGGSYADAIVAGLVFGTIAFSVASFAVSRYKSSFASKFLNLHILVAAGSWWDSQEGQAAIQSQVSSLNYIFGRQGVAVFFSDARMERVSLGGRVTTPTAFELYDWMIAPHAKPGSVTVALVDDVRDKQDPLGTSVIKQHNPRTQVDRNPNAVLVPRAARFFTTLAHEIGHSLIGTQLDSAGQYHNPGDSRWLMASSPGDYMTQGVLISQEEFEAMEAGARSID